MLETRHHFAATIFTKYNHHKEIHKTSMLKIKICYLSCSWDKYTYFSILIWFKNASNWQIIRITYEETFHLTAISIHFQYLNIRLELPSTLKLSRRCISFSLSFLFYLLHWPLYLDHSKPVLRNFTTSTLVASYWTPPRQQSFRSPRYLHPQCSSTHFRILKFCH